MSLFFNANQTYVSHGSSTGLVDIDSPTYLFLGVCRDASQTGSRLMFTTGLHNISANNVGGGGSAGQLSYFRQRATTNSIATSAVGQFVTGDQIFAVFIDDYLNDAPRIYLSVNNNPLHEVSSYNTQTQGSGAVTAAAAAMLMGSRNTNTTFCDWNLSRTWVYNRILRRTEMEGHLYNVQTQLTGCKLRTWYRSREAAHLRDLSGNGNNGTINNAPPIAAEPILFPARIRRWRAQQVAATPYPLWLDAAVMAQSPIPVAYH